MKEENIVFGEQEETDNDAYRLKFEEALIKIEDKEDV